MRRLFDIGIESGLLVIGATLFLAAITMLGVMIKLAIMAWQSVL